MNPLEQLGVALGLATLAGLNLYLTTFVAGLAIRFHWVDLSGPFEHLSVLANPWIIGVAGAMFLIEFFADKVPWVDSVWDVAHTVIRPAGGVLLALTVLGEMNPVALTIGGLLAGTATLSTHGTKAGIRALLNLSPEPMSNSVASVTEDGLVLGGLGLIGAAPLLSLVVFTVVVLVCGAIAFRLWRKVIRFLRMRRHQAAPGSQV